MKKWNISVDTVGNILGFLDINTDHKVLLERKDNVNRFFFLKYGRNLLTFRLRYTECKAQKSRKPKGNPSTREADFRAKPSQTGEWKASKEKP